MPREAVDPEQTFFCGKRSCNIGKELALHELESARWKIDRLRLALEAGIMTVRPAEVRRPEEQK